MAGSRLSVGGDGGGGALVSRDHAGLLTVSLGRWRAVLRNFPFSGQLQGFPLFTFRRFFEAQLDRFCRPEYGIREAARIRYIQSPAYR